MLAMTEKNFCTQLFSWNVQCKGVVGGDSPQAEMHICREEWQEKCVDFLMGHMGRGLSIVCNASITNVVPICTQLFSRHLETLEIYKKYTLSMSTMTSYLCTIFIKSLSMILEIVLI